MLSHLKKFSGGGGGWVVVVSAHIIYFSFFSKILNRFNNGEKGKTLIFELLSNKTINIKQINKTGTR